MLCKNVGESEGKNEICCCMTFEKRAANWVINEVKAYCNKHKITADKYPVTPFQLGTLVSLVHDGSITHSEAKKTLREMEAHA